MSQSAPMRSAHVVLALVVSLMTAACSASSGQPAWTPLPPRTATPPPASAGPDASSSAGPASEAPPASEEPQASAGSPAPGGETVELTIGTDTGTALQFDPATVTAPAGATVEVTFENRSAGVPHNLTFDEPIDEATSTTVQAGSSESLEFTAPEPGDYKYVCTLHPGMEGTLTVEGS